jgi:hypothetical protein
MGRLLCALVCATVSIACGAPRDDGDVTSDQVAAYRLQHRQIEIAAARYDNAVASAMGEFADVCISMHRAYNRDVRVNVFQLASLDTELDATILARGGGAAADLACTTAAITAELDFHGAVACQETADADNQAEASRHLIALGTLIDHAAVRIDEIEAGLASWSLPSGCP